MVLKRARVVNRLFAVEEGHPDNLEKELDHHVTVIDPAKVECELEQDLRVVRTSEELERALAGRMERRRRSKEDIPLVEDFPLAPQEETPDFGHLAMTLNLRMYRALQHWGGNTHLTLTEIIMRLAEQGQLNKPGALA